MDIWAQPGAKTDEVSGLYQGCLKVRIKAPAVDNKANKAIMKFLCSKLGLKTRQIRLESGLANRKKTFHIESEYEPSWELLVPDGFVVST
ncbi:MAG: DUF167 domain-containing protein [Proteobacteria bacterium]|nr:DUF167 domain-containing protein [Pseudomonadota bacterium]MBU1612137.1 DUF167 domain-containing protein [Pseudomonadota bacterium]